MATTNMPSVAQLKAELLQQGFEVQDGAKHYKVLKEGRLISILPKSGNGTARGVRNNLATLKNNGLIWPPPPPAKKKAVPAIKGDHPFNHPFTVRLRNFTEGRQDRIEALAKLLGIKPALVQNYGRGLALPSAAVRAAMEDYMQEHTVRAKPKKAFNQKAYYASIGIPDHHTYKLLADARRAMDWTKLLNALTAKGGSQLAAARATESQIYGMGEKYQPNMPSIKRMLLWLDRPISDFAPTSLRWPLEMGVSYRADDAPYRSDDAPAAPQAHILTPAVPTPAATPLAEYGKHMTDKRGPFRPEITALATVMDALDPLTPQLKRSVLRAALGFVDLIREWSEDPK